MSILFLAAIWVVTVTPFLNGVEMPLPPGSSPIVPVGSEKTFQTFNACMNDLDKTMVEFENNEFVNRFVKGNIMPYENGFEVELDMPLPDGARATMRWECQQLKDNPTPNGKR